LNTLDRVLKKLKMRKLKKITLKDSS